jgi:uncharacterized protein (TIGR03790 family)
MQLSARGPRLLASSVLLLTALFLSAGPAHAQSAENVLLVINDSSQPSVRIGEYYASKRGISQQDVVHLKIESNDEISAGDFSRLVQAPIADWFARRGAHDRILYIVLTKGVPLRIAGTSGRRGTVASVDSELALLYRRMTGAAVPLDGPVPNPYFHGAAPLVQAQAFTHQAHDIFLVTRLDGFSVEDVLALVDRGAAPVAGGRFLLDERASWVEKGNEWLAAAAGWLTANGFANRVTLETTSNVLAGEPDVMGYYSWGSNDPAATRRHFGFTFMPGAIAAMFVSSDARTFTEPPPQWRPGSWNDPKSIFAGSPQSLAGDLIHDGVTGIAGQVAEPYLDATVRPDILFPAYVSGFNLAESFFLALPYLSWQTVVVGDPLCAPFGRKRVSPGRIDSGLDAATGLPAMFARRRLREVTRQVPNENAATLIVKAEGCLGRDDRAGARAALEQATALEPRASSAQLALAGLYDQAGETDKAIERYRRTLEGDSNNADALNNLAYALATRKQRPGDGLPLAEKAYALSGGKPSVADTLGWIHHLLGDDGKAGPFMLAAVKGMPDSGEVQLHLAVVLGARGMLEPARAALARAIELAPELEKRSEVLELRAKLKGERK